MRCVKAPVSGALVAALSLSGAPLAWASSHSDAPLIKQDPQANLTDVYAFIGTRYNNENQKVLNVLVSVRPFSEPGDGVMYDRFADDAVYSIHIADPNSGATLIRYDFQFSDVNPLTTPGLKNPNTILSYGLGTLAGPISDIGDAQQNYTQTYTVKKGTATVGSGLKVAPPNVGKRTTPAYNDADGRAVSGAADFAGLDSYTKQAVQNLSSGEAVFAGPREDGFYADTPGIFDLLDARIVDNDGEVFEAGPPGDVNLGQDGGGVDGFKGYNLLSYGLQIPVNSLPRIDYNAPFFGPAQGVGVYASVSRPRITLRRTDGEPVSSGPFIQVNRLANPLFNEVLVALKDKDNYNRTSPTADASMFKTYAENPEVAFLINFVFGTSLATSGRTDLSAVYIPDVIRVDTRTEPVQLPGSAGFNRLSFLGSDIATGTVPPGTSISNAGGWPNGRRIGDDVVDIALTAVASGPSYSTIIVVGDNIAGNDQIYNKVFPYLATPHAGPRNSKDSGVTPP